MLPILVGITAITFSSYLYAIVAYDPRCSNNSWLSYTLSIVGAIISVSAWTYVIRHYKDPNTTMIVSAAWDLGVALMLIFFPLILFDFKIDLKTIVGCTIAAVGLIIAKF